MHGIVWHLSRNNIWYGGKNVKLSCMPHLKTGWSKSPWMPAKITLVMQYNQTEKKLKADRPHPPDYSTQRQTPWTDNDSSMLIAALSFNTDRCAPEPWPLTLKQGNSDVKSRFLAFDLDLWPQRRPTIQTLQSSRSTYIQNIKVVGHTDQLWECRRMDRQTLPSTVSVCFAIHK